MTGARCLSGNSASQANDGHSPRGIAVVRSGCVGRSGLSHECPHDRVQISRRLDGVVTVIEVCELFRFEVAQGILTCHTVTWVLYIQHAQRAPDH